jgi:5-methylcytosine-specific restriction protein A
VPTAALRPCVEPGCPALVPSGRCAAHQTARYRQVERTRGTAKERGYDKDWRRVRDDVLRDEPCCRLCAPAVSLAVEVDHVKPLAQGGARLDRLNLQPLCNNCHIAKTSSENAGRRRERITRTPTV